MINKEKIQMLVKEFLYAIEEDPAREGLKDTPRRVADMFDELLNPMKANATYTSFESENYGGIILLKNIEFSSFCEHHLLPFIGEVHIAYIPNENIIGLSKLARIVDKHAKRLQLQERFTSEILEDIQTAINPRGLAVYVEANHLCMNIRGIAKRNATTVTSIFSGIFEDLQMQNLFLSLVKKA